MQLLAGGNLERVLGDVKSIVSSVKDIQAMIQSGFDFGKAITDVEQIIAAVEDIAALLKANPKLQETLNALIK